MKKKQSQHKRIFQCERNFDFSSLLFCKAKKQTRLRESGDIDIKKLVANSVPESAKKGQVFKA